MFGWNLLDSMTEWSVSPTATMECYASSIAVAMEIVQDSRIQGFLPISNPSLYHSNGLPVHFRP